MTKKQPKKTYNIPKELAATDDQTYLQQLQQLKPEVHFTRIKHMANLGDIVSSMVACKKFYELTGRKIVFSQRVNAPAAYYNGATHPTKDADGVQVCINDKMWEMVKPLVESQQYIHQFERYEGQHINLDFDVIRGKLFVGMPNLMIQSWLMFAFPDLAINLTNAWIDLPAQKHKIQKQVRGKILVGFTERYRNNVADYFFLKDYASELVFAGTEREHWLFSNTWQLNIPRLQVNDFLELAYAVKFCRFTLTNQSFIWNIAQSIQKARILELCSYAANCQPFIGEHSYGFYHQTGLEFYFRKLYSETLKKPH